MSQTPYTDKQIKRKKSFDCLSLESLKTKAMGALRCWTQKYFRNYWTLSQQAKWLVCHLTGTSAICDCCCREFDYSPWTPSYISKSDWLGTGRPNASAEDDFLLMNAGADSSHCFREHFYIKIVPWQNIECLSSWRVTLTFHYSIICWSCVHQTNGFNLERCCTGQWNH